MSAAADKQRGDDPAISYLAGPRQAAPPPLQFSLSTLLLVTTLVAVAVGLSLAVPPLGGWFIVVGSLALVRTMVECRRMLKDGRPLDMRDKLGSFVGSLGFSFLAVVCSMIVFGSLGILAALGIGIVNWIVEQIGSPALAAWAGGLVSLILTLGVIAITAITFFAVYWRSISPRTTLDPPRPRPEDAIR